jgi:hypothetical protein
VKATDVKALNVELKKQHLAVIDLDTRELNRNREDELEMGDEE